MSDLAAWLLEQIAEDEKRANECAEVYPAPWELSDRGWVAYVKADAPDFREVARLEDQSVAGGEVWLGDRLAHIARWDPARALAECAAKRRIIELAAHEPGRKTTFRREMILQALALPYADRPGWREEWRA